MIRIDQVIGRAARTGSHLGLPKSERNIDVFRYVSVFSKDQLTKMIIWLLENRGGLTVFIHPITGDDILDHTDHAIWLGNQVELNYERLK